MTATTVAPATPDVDLEALLRDDDEQQCQMLVGPTGDLYRCPNPARWISHATFPCRHHGPTTALACDPCHDLMARRIVWCQDSCGVLPVITWMERIR